ncbi:PREDICTED: protein ROS1-like [Fragaria vesca subsp. vesca]|uniref:protein ROS1-like n=1 Tax=Fragaria vesca subsp. vesca TaxID=101020 RepID=UPI0002C3008E|nr:PREDICTED: protein ROS1-like [Fragaria vesca subsp. vesca]
MTKAPRAKDVMDSSVHTPVRPQTMKFYQRKNTAKDDIVMDSSVHTPVRPQTMKFYQRKNRAKDNIVMDSSVHTPVRPQTMKVYQRKNRAKDDIVSSVHNPVKPQTMKVYQRKRKNKAKVGGDIPVKTRAIRIPESGSIEGSFMPVPSQPESMSQYNLKNGELVDGKFCIGDTSNISILKRKLHDATLQTPQKRLRRPNKKVYRPKVVPNLGMSVPRMELKTPTKETPKRMNNVSLKKSFITIDLQKIQKKKRLGRRRMEVERWQKIAIKFQANYLEQKYNKRRAAPGISQKELQKLFDNEQQLSPCFITQSGDLNIEESLSGIVSLLESDDLELLVKKIDTFEVNISHKSNHGIRVCYQENEKHGPHVELGIVAHANGERGMVAMTKKKGRWQEKLEKLEHGELFHPWNLQLQNIVKEGDIHDEEHSQFWEKERELFRGRIDLFLTRMRDIQGNRTFSEWDGSVVDSIVGVFLTQNVSDHLSSSAFISLAAAFPCQPTCDKQSKIVKIEEYIEGGTSKSSCEPSNDQTYGEDINIASSTSNLVLYDESECLVLYDESECWDDIISNNSQTHFNAIKQKGKKLKLKAKQKGKKLKADAEEINNIEGALVNETPGWDYYKKKIELNCEDKRMLQPRDSVNWQAVRQADVDDIAEVIKGRGQQHNIADRIKQFLNEVNEDHKEINLEWLRWAPAEQARTYLTTIKGIGLKSVECVRLLALKQIAFPVDVNVARIAVRLGWVPLQPLPEDVQIHVLENMPVVDDIQKYLWPRLKKLRGFKELYELHYHLITFGKVYCTKRKPNCHSCPMKNECKYYLSAYASAKHAALPKSTETQRQMKRDENNKIVCASHLSSRCEPPNPTSHTFIEDTTKLEYKLRECEPIIEEPASPGRSSPEPEYVERDIEDLFTDESVTRSPHMNAFGGSDISSLVPFMTREEAFSIPARRLKEIERLRTKHSVYKIEKESILFKELKLERRDPRDKYPYLFAMCKPTPVSQPHEDRCSCNGSKDSSCDGEETCFSCSSLSTQDDTDTIRGTILIPCRTATRGSFPLNGTYFQINEVFADHESSINPIKVHRDLLWNQTTRDVYCGTSASHILKGLSRDELSECFKDGFICVRAFNRRTRTPEPLHERLHISTVKTAKKGKKKLEPEEDDD